MPGEEDMANLTVFWKGPNAYDLATGVRVGHTYSCLLGYRGCAVEDGRDLPELRTLPHTELAKTRNALNRLMGWKVISQVEAAKLLPQT